MGSMPSGLFARCVLAATCALALGDVQTTRAQAFELNRFRPAPLVSDGFAVAGASSPGHLGFNLAAHLDYAHEPLIVELATREQYQVVSHQAAVHLGIALGLGERTTVFGGLPVNVVMNGGDPPDGIFTRLARPDGAGLGDAYLGARLRLLGDDKGRAVLAAQATMSLPLASVRSRQLYSGDDMIAVEPRVLLDVHLGRTTLRMNVGARIRQDEDLLDSLVGDELSYGVGAQYRFARTPLRLIADVYGATGFKNFAQGTESPIEALLGGKFQHASGFHAALAAGPGFAHGVGTPEVRALATVGFTRVRADPPVERAAAPAAPPREPPAEDAREPVAPADQDGDGLVGDADRCPLEAEDHQAPDDHDGCPVLDDDRDGVPDATDQCPGEAEDLDAHLDDDGCADPDNDGDGIRDASDACPLEVGEAEQNGCPSVRVDAASGTLSVLGRVRFATGDEHALPGGIATLRRIKRELEQDTSIQRVRVEGYADPRGQTTANLNLSKRRARVIARWLRDNGIALERLQILACGETPVPEDAASIEDRRVDLRASEPQAAEDCTPVSLR